jgi:hypothetical protein
MSGTPEHRIFIGTFHKTGTALMSKIWQAACRRLDLTFWPMHEKNAPRPETWHVCFNNHSRFGEEPSLVEHRGALVIRDPRDIVISGMHYHQKAREEWLHRPNPRFGGMTYQEKLNSLPTEEDRLLFELNHTGRGTIRQITQTMEQFPQFRRVKLEQLLEDHDLMEYHRLYAFLGFSGEAIVTLLDVSLANSIFSGKVKRSVHVRSGRPAQWKAHFTPRVMEAFIAAHGDLPERWGYEAPSAAEYESKLIA